MKGTCIVEGCERPIRDSGMCNMHRSRVRRHGDPNVRLTQYHDHEARFWKYVDKTDGCWLWMGVLTWDGYGLFTVNKKKRGAHRWSYQLLVGDIPEGMQIDHLCRVKNCVRPEHLEAVTSRENTQRAADARYGTHCKRGHAYTFDDEGRRRCRECYNEARRERMRKARVDA